MVLISNNSANMKSNIQAEKKFNVENFKVTISDAQKIITPKSEKYPKEPGYLLIGYSAPTSFHGIELKKSKFLRLAYVKKLPNGKVHVKIKDEIAIELPRGTSDSQIKAYIAKTKLSFQQINDDATSKNIKGFTTSLSFTNSNSKVITITTPVYSNEDLGLYTLDKNGSVVKLAPSKTNIFDDEHKKIQEPLKKLYEEGRLAPCQYTIR